MQFISGKTVFWQYHTNEVVGLRINYSSDDSEEMAGIVALFQDFCRIHIAEMESPLHASASYRRLQECHGHFSPLYQPHDSKMIAIRQILNRLERLSQAFFCFQCRFIRWMEQQFNINGHIIVPPIIH